MKHPTTLWPTATGFGLSDTTAGWGPTRRTGDFGTLCFESASPHAEEDPAMPCFCPAMSPMQYAHNLARARYATLSQNGLWVYLCCGDCGTRYRETVRVWETELRRRAEDACAETVPHDRFYRATI